MRERLNCDFYGVGILLFVTAGLVQDLGDFLQWDGTELELEEDYEGNEEEQEGTAKMEDQ